MAKLMTKKQAIAQFIKQGDTGAAEMLKTAKMYHSAGAKTKENVTPLGAFLYQRVHFANQWSFWWGRYSKEVRSAARPFII